MYIVSSCLLGHNCKYDGGNNMNKEVIEFCRSHKFVSVCPEMSGGLSCPRTPAERVGDKVLNKEGSDVTCEFKRGAEICLKNCLETADLMGERIEGAILKANSPSCGSGSVYDGTFSGIIIHGDGIFTEMLKAEGIEVITEKEKIKW